MLATDAVRASTSGQQLAFRQLQDVEAADSDALEILKAYRVAGWTQLFIEVCVNVGKPTRAPGGLKLRPREKFTILVGADFPYALPDIKVEHQRFAGFGHVFWGTVLCLYQAPETEFNPAEGMFGYITRLLSWLHDASNDNLDPAAQPLHPPAAAIDYKLPLRLVAQQDTPAFEEEHWFGLAKLKQISATRQDIVGWVEVSAIAHDQDLDGYVLYPAFLTKGRMPHQFPTKGAEIISHLEKLGCPRALLFTILRASTRLTPEKKAFCLLFGCAMRGLAHDRRQHLTAWYIKPDEVDALRLSLANESENPELAEIGERVMAIVNNWFDEVDVSWCPIMENRKEIVVSRQDQTPATAFTGLRVAVWGCGALGSHVATFLAQAEVAALHLVDNKLVHPGILGRQLFDDLDIGDWKCEALAARIRRLRPSLSVTSQVLNLVAALNDLSACLGQFDLIIDCSASPFVMLKLEKEFNLTELRRPQTASMVIDARAERAMLLYCPAGSPGSLRDASFRSQMMMFDSGQLASYLDTFFPETAPTLVQPEPGCSEPTFRGSGADCAVLSAIMFNGLGEFIRKGAATSFALASQPLLAGQPPPPAFARELPTITVCSRAESGVEVRLLEGARTSIVDHVRRHKLRRRAHLETGGQVFGQVDESSGVVWVTHATEPPPDSEESRELFLCGIEGTKETSDELRGKYRSSVGFLGTWHTHPDCAPYPSTTDLRGMAQMLFDKGSVRRHCLLLILSMTRYGNSLGSYFFRQNEVEPGVIHIVGEGDSIDFLLTSRPS